VVDFSCSIVVLVDTVFCSYLVLLGIAMSMCGTAGAMFVFSLLIFHHTSKLCIPEASLCV